MTSHSITSEPDNSKKNMSSCPNGKVVYTSEAKARGMQKVLLEKKEQKLTPYKCSLGNHWHLTHSSDRERRRDHRTRDREKRRAERIAEKAKK